MDGPETDHDLLQKVATGDRLALRVLYERYSNNIGAFVSRWLGDPSEASDITHETMLEVWRSANRFQGRSSVKTWIFTIARNKAIDRNRKSARTVLKDADPEIEDQSPDPQAVTEAFQNAKQVRICVEKLSPAHKSAIHLAFYQDLSYVEIAEIEKRPVGTVKTRIMHAKKLLMHCLKAAMA